MENKFTKQHLKLLILFILYLVGLIMHFSLPKGEMLTIKLTPYFLTLINLALIFDLLNITLVNKQRIRVITFCIITYLFTMLTEIIGVNTGLIFGDYGYTNNLEIQFLGVPLIIGLNWIVVSLGVFAILDHFFTPVITNSKIYQTLYILLFALLITGIDLFIEPYAIKINLWHWNGSEIPIFNYISWFFIGIIIGLLKLTVLHKRYKIESPALFANILLQLVYFAAIIIF